MSDPLAHLYAGRDYTRRCAWVARLCIAPSPSLMTRREDEGRIELAGFEVELSLSWSEERRVDRKWPEPRLSLRCRSDASEIATRLAQPAGC